MPSSSEATRARRRGMPMAARSPAMRSRTSRPIPRSASTSRCRLRSSPPDGRPPTSSARASLRCASRTPLHEIDTTAPVTALSFDRTTLLLASGTHVRLFDLAKGRATTVRFRSGVLAAVLDPTGHVFAVATRSRKSTTAAILSAQAGRVVRHLPEKGIRSFAFSSDGKLLASGSYDLTAQIWNARTGELRHVLHHTGHVLAERFSSDG